MADRGAHKVIIPRDISILQFAHSLIVDFPDDDIPILEDEKDWKEWGDYLIQCDSFAKNGSPSTQGFDDQQSWMSAVFSTMANS